MRKELGPLLYQCKSHPKPHGGFRIHATYSTTKNFMLNAKREKNTTGCPPTSFQPNSWTSMSRLRKRAYCNEKKWQEFYYCSRALNEMVMVAAVCVRVCHNEKSARRMASTTSDTGDTSSKQHVCVCVSQWKKVPDEWQARQATPAILQVSSSKHNSKKITTRVRGPYLKHILQQQNSSSFRKYKIICDVIISSAVCNHGTDQSDRRTNIARFCNLTCTLHFGPALASPALNQLIRAMKIANLCPGADICNLARLKV